MSGTAHRSIIAATVLLAVAVVAGLLTAAKLGLFSAPSSTPPPSTAAPLRLVSLSPAVTIILRDLGAAPLIVGRDKYDMVSDPAIPVCGDFQDVQYEALVRTRPTHILLQRLDVPERLRTMAAANNWTIRHFSSILTLDDIRTATRSLAELVGASPDALLKSMDRAWQPRGTNIAAAGRILLIESVDPPAALGPGSFHHQILVALGGTPAITEGKPYMPLDAEDILRLKPDAIIYFNPRPPHASPAAPLAAEQLRTMLGRIGTLDIPANRRRLAVIDDPLGLTPSTAMIGMADEMARVLERFAATPAP